MQSVGKSSSGQGGDYDEDVKVEAVMHVRGRASREVVATMPRGLAAKCGAKEVESAD